MTTDNTDSPSWVHWLGTATASLGLTTLLFYSAFAFRLGKLLSPTDWTPADVGGDPGTSFFIGLFGAVIFIPLGWVTFAALRRFGVRPRRAWIGVAIVAIAALVGWAQHGSTGGEATTPTAVQVIGLIVFLALFGAIVAAGTWGGRRLTRIDTPLQNRRVLAAGAVLIALVASPTAIAAVVDDPEPKDNFEESVDGSDTNFSYTEMTDTTLGEAICSAGDNPALAEAPTNVTATEHRTIAGGETPVSHQQDGLGAPIELYDLAPPVEDEIVGVHAATTHEEYDAVAFGRSSIRVQAPHNATTRVWIDAVNDDGEVVRHQFDLCPQPEE